MFGLNDMEKCSSWTVNYNSVIIRWLDLNRHLTQGETIRGSNSKLDYQTQKLWLGSWGIYIYIYIYVNLGLVTISGCVQVEEAGADRSIRHAKLPISTCSLDEGQSYYMMSSYVTLSTNGIWAVCIRYTSPFSFLASRGYMNCMEGQSPPLHFLPFLKTRRPNAHNRHIS